MQKYKTVDEFLGSLDSDKKAQVEALRKIILDSSPGLEEHIKWNAPSYIYEGEDRITFNTLNKQGVVNIVLHMGALRKEDKKAAPILHDTTGLISWSSDIRGMIRFENIKDVQAKSEKLSTVLKQWLAIGQ